MNQLIRFGAILAIICLLATLILAVTYEVTKPKIDAQVAREEREALRSIVPSADKFEEKSIGNIEYFDAMRGKEPVGYCVRIVAVGYSGYIRLMVGIDPSGVITGVEVLEHYETPGLGSRINEIKQGERDPWFLRQFKGKQASSLAVKKNIDAITGATISSAAVTDAIRKTVATFLAGVKR